MPNEPTLAQRVSTSFSQLAAIATDLNAVSDELGKSVSQIDTALKNLNLGISVWVMVTEWDPGESEDYQHWSEHVGYAKTSGKWGISLKRVEGNHRNPERDDVEAWLFNDAPRKLRLQAIDKIPQLLEHLSTQAALAIANIQAKLSDVQAVAAAMNPPRVPTSAKKASFAKAALELPQPFGIAEAMNQAQSMDPLARLAAERSASPGSVVDLSWEVKK